MTYTLLSPLVLDHKCDFGLLLHIPLDLKKLTCRQWKLVTKRKKILLFGTFWTFVLTFSIEDFMFRQSFARWWYSFYLKHVILSPLVLDYKCDFGLLLPLWSPLKFSDNCLFLVLLLLFFKSIAKPKMSVSTSWIS